MDVLYHHPPFVCMFHLMFFPVGSFCNKNDTKCISSSCQNNSHVQGFLKRQELPLFRHSRSRGTKTAGKRRTPASSPCPEHATRVRVPGERRSLVQMSPPGTAGPAVTRRWPLRAQLLPARGRLPLGLRAPCVRLPRWLHGKVLWADLGRVRFQPCLHGAVCRDGGDGYFCFCVPGYQLALWRGSGRVCRSPARTRPRAQRDRTLLLASARAGSPVSGGPVRAQGT